MFGIKSIHNIFERFTKIINYNIMKKFNYISRGAMVMLKLTNGHEYKLVYLDTNAISGISKNYKSCLKTF